MTTLVLKFGGNALYAENGILAALDIIATQHDIWDQLVVVTSALGGVTNQLHDIVQITLTHPPQAFRQEVAQLRQMHMEIAHTVMRHPQALENLIKELDMLFFKLLDNCDVLNEKKQFDSMIADRIVAMGELFVTRIVAAAGRNQGLSSVALDANRLIVTDDRHANARPITALTQRFLEQNLMPLLQQRMIPIITGYIGANEKGNVTTLGRGGSDYSATYIGSLLNADEVWFFTDVGGLMSADPAMVTDAHILPISSYEDVAEMARFGARVLHPHAIEPLMQANIPLRIRSLRDMNGGTYITSHSDSYENRIHAVTVALGLQVVGPSQTNLAEVCNRLIAQYINDEIQPTVQIDIYEETRLVYVAPTNVNQQMFYNCIDYLQNYQETEDWTVHRVAVLAVVGHLLPPDHINIFQELTKADIIPLAFGQGSPHVFLVVLEPEQANTALRQVHTLIKK